MLALLDITTVVLVYCLGCAPIKQLPVELSAACQTILQLEPIAVNSIPIRRHSSPPPRPRPHKHHTRAQHSKTRRLDKKNLLLVANSTAKTKYLVPGVRKIPDTRYGIKQKMEVGYLGHKL